MLSDVTAKAKVVTKKQPAKVAGQAGKYSVPVVRCTFRILLELSRASVSDRLFHASGLRA